LLSAVMSFIGFRPYGGCRTGTQSGQHCAWHLRPVTREPLPPVIQHPRGYAVFLRKGARRRSARLPPTRKIEHLVSSIILCLHARPPAEESTHPTRYGRTVFVERLPRIQTLDVSARAWRTFQNCLLGAASAALELIQLIEARPGGCPGVRRTDCWTSLAPSRSSARVKCGCYGASSEQIMPWLACTGYRSISVSAIPYLIEASSARYKSRAAIAQA
jgi:hypothetical protein